MLLSLLCSLGILATWASDHHVFSFRGSFHGFGDITGPLWTLLDLKRRRPLDHFTALIDDRAEDILKQLYTTDHLDKLGHSLGIKIIHERDAIELEPADFSFELFHGGRKIQDFEQLVYHHPRTVTIIEDTMHGNHYDELRMGGRSFYFQPPGMGVERSGIIDNPDLHRFRDSSKTTSLLLESFQGMTEIQQFLMRPEVAANPRTFVYGVHNEKIVDKLIGQTKDFLQTLQEMYADQGPLIAFAPHSKEDFEAIHFSDQHFQILDRSNLANFDLDPSRITIVALGPVQSLQFLALLASSTMPVLLEGNSSVSTALRLQIPFVPMRSPWNATQIETLARLEERFLGSSWLQNTYNFREYQLPDLKGLLRSKLPAVFYQALNVRIPSLAKKLDNLINFSKSLQMIEKNPVCAPHIYIQLIEKTLKRTPDPILEVSLFDSFYKSGRITRFMFDQAIDLWKANGVPFLKFREQFKPIKPYFRLEDDYLARARKIDFFIKDRQLVEPNQSYHKPMKRRFLPSAPHIPSLLYGERSMSGR